MSDQRISHAAARIETALRRIATASEGAAANGSAAAEFSHLATRHDALRDEVREALQAIDALAARSTR